MSVTHIVIPVKSQQVTLNKRVDHKNPIILVAFRQILQKDGVLFRKFQNISFYPSEGLQQEQFAADTVTL